LHTQSVTLLDPSGLLACDGHPRHTATLVPALVPEYVFAPQFWHVASVLAPTTAEYLPAAHATHALSLFAEGVVEYLPAAQLVHVSDPGAAHVPSGHVPTTTSLGDLTVSSTLVTVDPRLAVVRLDSVMPSLAFAMSYVATVYCAAHSRGRLLWYAATSSASSHATPILTHTRARAVSGLNTPHQTPEGPFF
jgi:hypothetical protein